LDREGVDDGVRSADTNGVKGWIRGTIGTKTGNATAGNSTKTLKPAPDHDLVFSVDGYRRKDRRVSAVDSRARIESLIQGSIRVKPCDAIAALTAYRSEFSHDRHFAFGSCGDSADGTVYVKARGKSIVHLTIRAKTRDVNASHVV
jgi:hypothetical protein